MINVKSQSWPLLPLPKPTVSYFDDLDFFKDFENEFPAIVYNDAQTSKSDLLTEPILNPQHIDEFNLKDETSLSECDEEEQNVLNFNDLFPFNVIYPDELKMDTDNDNDKVDIEHSSGDLSVKPLPDVINTDVGAYAHESNKLLETILYKVEDIATCLAEYVKFWDDWEVDRYGNANLDYYSEDQYAVSIKKDTAYSCLHSPKTIEDKAQYAVKMDDPNITMEEYIRLEEEKAQKCGKVISFDEFDDDDYTVNFDKNSFSYKIISVNDLKTDLENHNDKVNMPLFPSPEPTVSYFDELDYFKDFEKEFPAIVYNDTQTSKFDFLTEPTLSPQHIDEFNLKDETSMSECDEEEQNIIYFNDLFPFNVIYLDDLKSDKDNDDDKIDVEYSSGDLSVKPLPDVINTDVGAYAHGYVKLWDDWEVDRYGNANLGIMAPGVVTPEIRGNVNFEIKSQFMRELREDTFSENKNEDAHDHVDRVINIVSLFNIPEVSQDTVLLRVFLFTLTRSAKRWVDRLTPGAVNTWDLLKNPLSKAIKRTSSRNVSSNNDTDGLAAVISKLENLGCYMKKLKENVHEIQVGCQICEGPRLDKECPLNEEVKQVDEVKYGEFGRPAPFNGSSIAMFRIGPPGYYTHTDNQTSSGEKKPNLVETINKYIEEATKRQAEQDEWLKTFCQNTKNSRIDHDKII
ncbi:hypothetical protein Tco_0954029 [Tanacetum coccineum]|uniref:Uncharacterized protein n=1 Tax=Tanacetum coccineum TaxID=301880 RepID=A0ABQ5E495_9ASTR